MVKGILIAVPVVAAVAVVWSGYYSVAPNEEAVVTRMGAIVRPEGPGGHLKMPFVEGVRIFRTDIDDVSPDKAVNTYTIDSQEVDVKYNVFFRIPSDRVEYVYRSVPDYKVRLATMATDRVKSEMGKYNVSSVAEHRGDLRDAIKGILKRDASSLGIEVTDFQLTDLQYDQKFRDAVAQAAVQKANVESMEYQRQQAEKSAETAKIKATGEANAVREKARGDADGRLLNAQAEAKAIAIQGEAQAAAIKAQSEALAQNANLVELRKAERWDGRLPSAVYAGAPIPFLNAPVAK